MKIISWNVNGIRNVYKKDFIDWLEEIRVDIICLQEIKAHQDQLPWDLTRIGDYTSYFSSASKKGFSGVAVYTKQKPQKVKPQIGLKRFDNEGRFLRFDFPQFSLINLYLPHGGRQKENLDYKLAAYDFLLDYLTKIKKENLLLIGDFNIAHKEIDLARPKQNKNNIMFTPEERKQIDKLIKLGFTDTFRKFHKKGEYYTWWLYQLRDQNIGWRIDYAFASKSLKPKIKDSFILSEVKGSDHCPIEVDVIL